MAVKILSAQQIKHVDAFTTEHDEVTSVELMERASRICAEAFLPYLKFSATIHVFCGSGNNGGDGLAISRILRKADYNVNSWFVPFAQLTPECSFNKDRLPNTTELLGPKDLPLIRETDTVIDALLGVGASRRPEGMLKLVIDHINNSGAQVLSVDLPSGLPADAIPDHDCIVKALFTATFQQPKLVFFLEETVGYIGDWEVLDIGLDRNEIAHLPGRYFHLDRNSTEALVKHRKRFSHKGTYGHGLLIAGSKGKTGSAVLASQSALRSGIGLLTVHIPAASLNILQISVPEAMCETDQNNDRISSTGELSGYSAIGIGPGLGQHPDSLEALKKVISSGKPLVIDADGLNLLAANPELLEKLPPGTILTPHPKEFARLAGESASSTERLERLIHFAQCYRCIVVLKDAITAIALTDGTVYFNTTGNPGMATGGAGDVLTGIVLGLLAQGYDPGVAARIAVYYHGKAGDDAAREKGESALIAGDLIGYLKID